VVVSGERSGQTVCAGQGAGGDATAVAVVSDLLAIAHGQTVPRSWPTTAPVLIDRDFNARHYVRVDQPVSSRPQGSTGESNPADPATALRLAGITPERVWQRGAPGHPRWAALVSPCSHVRLNLALDALQPARGAGRMVLGLPIFGVDRLAATPR
jgi:homoserine dehydrogenase